MPVKLQVAFSAAQATALKPVRLGLLVMPAGMLPVPRLLLLPGLEQLPVLAVPKWMRLRQLAT